MDKRSPEDFGEERSQPGAPKVWTHPRILVVGSRGTFDLVRRPRRSGVENTVLVGDVLKFRGFHSSFPSRSTPDTGDESSSRETPAENPSESPGKGKSGVEYPRSLPHRLTRPDTSWTTLVRTYPFFSGPGGWSETCRNPARDRLRTHGTRTDGRDYTGYLT